MDRMNNSSSLSTHEICQIFDISKSTLFRWQDAQDFPYLGRATNNQRSYNLEHLKYIANKQLIKYKKRYDQWRKGFDQIDDFPEQNSAILVEYKELTAEIALNKFLIGDEIGLDELELYAGKPISESLIIRLDRIASKLYRPGDKQYTQLHKIIVTQSEELQKGF